ncbi:MAG TPA: hypothetical protein VGD05_09245, partial [Pyrinomonadaceae bacterium]
MSETKPTLPTEETPEHLADPNPPAESIEANNDEPPAKQQSVAKSAGIVSIAVMFSRVLGLVREMIFARF